VLRRLEGAYELARITLEHTALGWAGQLTDQHSSLRLRNFNFFWELVAKLLAGESLQLASLDTEPGDQLQTYAQIASVKASLQKLAPQPSPVGLQCSVTEDTLLQQEFDGVVTGQNQAANTLRVRTNGLAGEEKDWPADDVTLSELPLMLQGKQSFENAAYTLVFNEDIHGGAAGGLLQTRLPDHTVRACMQKLKTEMQTIDVLTVSGYGPESHVLGSIGLEIDPRSKTLELRGALQSRYSAAAWETGTSRMSASVDQIVSYANAPFRAEDTDSGLPSHNAVQDDFNQLDTLASAIVRGGAEITSLAGAGAPAQGAYHAGLMRIQFGR
jgi:hypothetical protein